MEGLSFSEFTKRIYIKAPLQQIYDHWCTPDGICRWFLREAVYTDPSGQKRRGTDPIAAGDSYQWHWHNWDASEKGEVTLANGRDEVEFSFAGVSRVRITLEPGKEAVLLNLRQYGIPTDDDSKLNLHYGCSNGWTFWLANLKAYLEYGVLLHETTLDLGKYPLAGFEFVNI
ncbi:MAG: SRPBCC family protein [Robiginitalea sp.]|jgi:uncharacterized protein YndB with AHSA1/START domain